MKEKKKWIEKLEKEGFRDIRIVPLPPSDDDQGHGHEHYQVDVILSGNLAISDKKGTRTYFPGDRLDVPAGTFHNARGDPDGGDMIVGVKEVDK